MTTFDLSHLYHCERSRDFTKFLSDSQHIFIRFAYSIYATFKPPVSSTVMQTTQKLARMMRLALIPFRAALFAGTVSLTLGIAACSPTDTTASTSPSSTDTASTSTETTAAATDTDAATATSAWKVYAKDGIAIGGADPVAYFAETDFVPGSAEYTYEWQGVRWQFASADNRDRFASAPEQYAPQYGGHCAWAVAAKNALVPIDPNAWSVIDGKLYLNANQKVQRNWEKDIPGFIAQAEQNWPALAAQ